jgi:AraC family transcriptional regulator
MNFSLEPSGGSNCSLVNERSRLDRPACEIDERLPRAISELHAILLDRETTAEERLRQAQAILGKFPELRERSNPVGQNGGTYMERGGLSPWQIRRVKEYIDQGLAGRLTGADLARRVKLSEHHFCRAFRVSLRQTPHAYVIGRRLERACDMMISNTCTIGQIATECGFADQAHLNRCFRKLLGTSPGVWRRAQIESEDFDAGNGAYAPVRASKAINTFMK